MSLYLSSAFLGLFRPPNPNDVYEKARDASLQCPRSRMRTPSSQPKTTFEKVLDVGGVVVAVTSAGSAIRQFATETSPVPDLTEPTNTTSIISNVANAAKETISNLTPDFVKSTWSWGSWGFSFLPTSVKVIVVISAVGSVWIAYKNLRYGGGGSVTNTIHNSHTINFHHLPPHCDVLTRKDGTISETNVVCRPPKRDIEKDITRLALHRLHKTLDSLYGEQHLLYSKELKEKVNTILSELDEAAFTRYEGIDVRDCLKKTREIKREIDEEIQDYTIQTIRAWKKKSLVTKVIRRFMTPTVSKVTHDKIAKKA